MSNLNSTYMQLADVYELGRPSYPLALYQDLVKKFDLTPDSKIAEVGCGTGLFCATLLEMKIPVIGIEPSEKMLETCRKKFAGVEIFEGRSGLAERTGLPDRSVDLICAAQSFHWFDWSVAGGEFKRISKSRTQSPVAVVYNERNRSSSRTGRALEAFVVENVPAYEEVMEYDSNWMLKFDEVFGPESISISKYPNKQVLDMRQFTARMLSSSFSPKAGDPGHLQYIEKLEAFFGINQLNNKIHIIYDCYLIDGVLI